MKKIEDCKIEIMTKTAEHNTKISIVFDDKQLYEMILPTPLIKSKFNEENFIQSIINFFIKGGKW